MGRDLLSTLIANNWRALTNYKFQRHPWPYINSTLFREKSYFENLHFKTSRVNFIL